MVSGCFKAGTRPNDCMYSRLPAHTFETQAEDLGHCLRGIGQNSFRFQLKN